MSKVLITGGVGHIGKYLVPEFIKKYDVKIFDILIPDHEKKVEYIRGDITNLNDIVEASKDVNSIIHLAAIPGYTGEDEKIMKINVLGSFNVLEAAKRNKIKNVVITSSVCAMGAIYKSDFLIPTYFPVDEEITNIPDDLYGMSKLIDEYLAYAHSTRYNIRIVCLRLATVMLPNLDYIIDARKNIDNPEYQFAEFAGTPITLKSLFWQYIDPRDLPQAYMLALHALEQEKIQFGVYNIGAEDVFSKVESLTLIQMYYPEIKYIKNEDGFLKEKYQTLYSISKAKNELGFSPKYTWRDFNP